MSIGSSATKTRPSGAAQTTDGYRIAGVCATSSIRQSLMGTGRVAAFEEARAASAMPMVRKSFAAMLSDRFTVKLSRPIAGRRHSAIQSEQVHRMSRRDTEERMVGVWPNAIRQEQPHRD